MSRCVALIKTRYLDVRSSDQNMISCGVQLWPKHGTSGYNSTVKAVKICQVEFTRSLRFNKIVNMIEWPGISHQTSLILGPTAKV